MMEHEPIKYPCEDDDFEEGQVSQALCKVQWICEHIIDAIFFLFRSIWKLSDDSADGYTPLARPPVIATAACPTNHLAVAVASASVQMEEASELDESLAEQSSDSDSGSENGFPKRNKTNKRKIHKWVRPFLFFILSK